MWVFDSPSISWFVDVLSSDWNNNDKHNSRYNYLSRHISEATYQFGSLKERTKNPASLNSLHHFPNKDFPQKITHHFQSPIFTHSSSSLVLVQKPFRQGLPCWQEGLSLSKKAANIKCTKSQCSHCSGQAAPAFLEWHNPQYLPLTHVLANMWQRPLFIVMLNEPFTSSASSLMYLLTDSLFLLAFFLLVAQALIVFCLIFLATLRLEISQPTHVFLCANFVVAALIFG